MSEQAESTEIPAHRYDGHLATKIELEWQKRWKEAGTFNAPNPVGDLSDGFDKVVGKPKMFVMDMFPYPSGSGLHVGHPLGFIGTDIFARYHRMAGKNVLHTMGFDAFGLPAEQNAVQTGEHPRSLTEKNVANMRRQLGRLGLGHDPRRSVSTTDVEFYRWTQWIFLQIYNSWLDPEVGKARPIAELVAKFEADNTNGWNDLDAAEQRRVLLDYRLTYVAEVPVNWCPALGTVLANEEVTNEGRSERGNYPVYKRPMRQWMMRITAMADRLIDDLEDLEWPDPIKNMQRNWIGRSTGALVDFATGDEVISVFTTRPDTLFGATYMVLAPEHDLVDTVTTAEQAEAVAAYRTEAGRKTEIERQSESKEKTGVFTGSYATNPVNGESIPIYIADYVLTGYGTGAIMAVPAHDQRDFDFAKKFGLAITGVIKPNAEWIGSYGVDADTWPEAYVGDGEAFNSGMLDGLSVAEAKAKITQWLEDNHCGKATINYKLRDWLFSRQRYWGEPFPIVWDENDTPIALPESELPVELPEIEDYAPQIVDAEALSLPEPPLGRATEWKHVTLDLGDGPKQYRRELNTMPQWAGSCWYYLRYADPTSTDVLIDPVNERYWMEGIAPDDTAADEKGGVDLYIGGVEHAVLHLLYSRFWHKVLFDLGHVTTIEPFKRLYNQGYIQADAFLDERGIHVEAAKVVSENGQFMFDGKPVTRQTGKMGKSLKNSVNPDDIYEQYGADALRLYEMAMGPLDTSRPWTDTGIVGLYRFLQRLWRNLVDEDTGLLAISDAPTSPETRKVLHKTIAGVHDDMEALRFNTAISKLIELNNHLTKSGDIDAEVAAAITLMLAPLAPHFAEEIWRKLGNAESLAWTPYPVAEAALLIDDLVDVPVQVQGKVRGKVTVPTGSDDSVLETAARAEPNVARHLEGQTVQKIVVIRDRLVNIVLK